MTTFVSSNVVLSSIFNPDKDLLFVSINKKNHYKNLERMKSIKAIIILMCLTALTTSCNSDDDNNTATVCDAKFFSFRSGAENPAAGDPLDVGFFTKFTTTGPVLLSNLSSSTFTNPGFLTYPISALNDDNSQLACLTYGSSKKLYKSNLNASSSIQISTVGSDLHAPVYVNNNLRFLKTTNIVRVGPFSSDRVKSFLVQLADESGTSTSTASLPIDLSVIAPNGINLDRIEAARIGTKVYFMADCQLIIYDTTLDQFSLQEIVGCNGTLTFLQGLEVSSANTLLIMAYNQSANPIEMKIIELPNIASGMYTHTVKRNILQTDLPATAPALIFILNRSGGRCTTYDKCDNKYYFTDGRGFTTSSVVYEVSLNNTSSVQEYNVGANFLFGLEVEN